LVLIRRAYVYIDVVSCRRVGLLSVICDKCHVNSIHHIELFILNDVVCRLSHFYHERIKYIINALRCNCCVHMHVRRPLSGQNYLLPAQLHHQHILVSVRRVSFI
jgi:hypothetical protein